ncbi:MAG: DUF2341 domain-containing protein, partial [bacterium]|nr:DUF2341 domain-containing protein [bacterium]
MDVNRLGELRGITQVDLVFSSQQGKTEGIKIAGSHQDLGVNPKSWGGAGLLAWESGNRVAAQVNMAALPPSLQGTRIQEQLLRSGEIRPIRLIGHIRPMFERMVGAATAYANTGLLGNDIPSVAALWVVSDRATNRFRWSRKLKKFLGNHKKLTFFFILCIILIVLFFAIFALKGNLVQEAQAAFWWDEDYQFRKPIFVSNNSSVNHVRKEVLVKTLDTSTLVSTGKMQSDCDDLRFVDDRGLVFDHWISTGCNTTSTNVWMMMDQIPVGASNVYAYYGNSSITNAEKRHEFQFEDGLVGYWKLDESGSALSAKDYSEGGNNGGARNWTSTNWTTGQISNAGALNGTNEYIEVPNNNSFNVSSLTMSAWIRVAAFPSTGEYPSIISRHNGGPTNAGYTLQISGTSGEAQKIRVAIGDGDFQAAVSSTNVAANVWYHVAGTFDGTTMTIFVNGVSENTATNGLTNYSNVLQVGYSPGNISGDDYFNGLIDDVKIYNRALSANEIASDYTRSTDALQRVASQVSTTISSTEEKGPGPFAYYPFDEGSYNVAYDATTNNNDATRGGVSSISANMPTWFANGKFNWSLNFDGTNDHVDAVD